MGVREFAREVSARVGRTVHAGTITRAIQGGRIPFRTDAEGRPQIPLEDGISAFAANTDPGKALGALVRDGRDLPGGAAPAGQAPAAHGTAAPGPPSLVQVKTAVAAVQLAQERLDLAERQRRVAEVAPLAAAFSRRIAGMIGQIETSLPDLARELAAQSGADTHRTLVTLRRWLRDLRADMARAAQAQGEALPELVGDAVDAESGGEAA